MMGMKFKLEFRSIVQLSEIQNWLQTLPVEKLQWSIEEFSSGSKCVAGTLENNEIDF